MCVSYTVFLESMSEVQGGASSSAEVSERKWRFGTSSGCTGSERWEQSTHLSPPTCYTNVEFRMSTMSALHFVPNYTQAFNL